LEERYIALTLSQYTTMARRGGQWSSCKSFRIQQDSATQFATAWYSASVLERETVACHLDDQETRLSPKKTQKPDVDLRVSGHLTQSVSL
jgi:hypothetical protein